ncbi:kinetochore protein SPC24 [Deinococcus sp. QL22]|uniref:kinetochore protein SPC24 n=1 Tax=Deinococcus sp. QL22 TaxID=2939437 RepID=UPI002016AABD|nr:kinetochore protein SPC24 [Deinococcus sp. QL22]UQN04844.1 kinetochore protein SPC24 [Deinococcus sp. QL22]
MEEKSLAQLGQELAELVKEYEIISARILSHPVFPSMPNPTGVEAVLGKGADSIRADLQESAERLSAELEKLRQALQTMENRSEQVPSDPLMN